MSLFRKDVLNQSLSESVKDKYQVFYLFELKWTPYGGDFFEIGQNRKIREK